jgi:hypothetical protein
MPRFALNRDIKFFESISRELLDAVIETTVVLFKLAIEDISTNLYGESLDKSYFKGTECTAVIERDDSSVSYEGFGPDSGQSVEFRFNRIKLKGKGFYPEIGDIIMHNDAYFEIDNVREDQLIGGQSGEKFSIIVSTFMTRKSSIQTEMRVI